MTSWLPLAREARVHFDHEPGWGRRGIAELPRHRVLRVVHRFRGHPLGRVIRMGHRGAWRLHCPVCLADTGWPESPPTAGGRETPAPPPPAARTPRARAAAEEHP